MITNSSILVIIACVIIVTLSLYALGLLNQVSKQKKSEQNKKFLIIAKKNDFDKKIFKSVLLITKAMQENQCDFSEGCWRICVLLQSLKQQTDLEIKFPAIFELYNSIKHFSILDNRKKLLKKERMKQDFQRVKLEAQFHDGIVKNLDLLHKYTIERIAILSI